MLRRRFKACRTTSCYLVISFDLVWQMSRFAGVAWPAARPHLTACAHVPGSMALRVLTFAGTWQINLAPSLSAIVAAVAALSAAQPAARPAAPPHASDLAVAYYPLADVAGWEQGVA